MVEQLLPRIFTDPLFTPLHPPLALSAEALEAHAQALEQERAALALKAQEKAPQLEALTLCAQLLEQVCAEMSADVIRECSAWHTLCKAFAEEVVVEAVIDSSQPTDRSALAEVYRQMRARREQWLSGARADSEADEQSRSAVMNEANAARLRYQHSAVLVDPSEVAAAAAAVSTSNKAAAAQRPLLRPADSPVDCDEAISIIPVELPTPKTYGLPLITPDTTFASSSTEHAQQQQQVLAAERKRWARITYQPVSVRLPVTLACATYENGGEPTVDVTNSTNSVVLTCVCGSPNARFVAAGTERGGVLVWAMPQSSGAGPQQLMPVLVRALPVAPSDTADSAADKNSGGGGGWKLSAVRELCWASNSTQLMSLNGRGVVSLWELSHVSSSYPLPDSNSSPALALPSTPLSPALAAALKSPKPTKLKGPEPAMPFVAPYSPLTAVFRLSLGLTASHAALTAGWDQQTASALPAPTPTSASAGATSSPASAAAPTPSAAMPSGPLSVVAPRRVLRVFAGDLFRPAHSTELPSIPQLKDLQPALLSAPKSDPAAAAAAGSGSTNAVVRATHTSRVLCFHPALSFTGHQPSVMFGLTGGLIVKWCVSNPLSA